MSMADRTVKVRRVLRVQERMTELEEWKLAQFERRLADGETLRGALSSALSTDHPLHGLFIDVIARRLRSLAEEMARVQGEKVRQSAKVRAETAKLRVAERLLARAAADAANQQAKKELLDLIDDLAGARRASLP